MLAERPRARQALHGMVLGVMTPRHAILLLAASILALAVAPAGAEDGGPSPIDSAREWPPAAEAETPSLDLTLSEGGALRGIPWSRLDPTAYELVRDVVRGPVVHREVRHIAFRSRKPVLDFLLDHPDFAAAVARSVKEGSYRLRRLGDTYEAEDGHGARGVLRPVLVDGGRRLYYIEGRYEVPLLPAVAGRMVLLLDTEHMDGADGVTYCELRVAGYVRLDEGLSQAILTRSLSEARVERKVRRFFRHVAALSRRAYDEPEALAEALDARPDLPADVLAEFRRLLLADLAPAWSGTEPFHLLEPALMAPDLAPAPDPSPSDDPSLAAGRE
jgi:hypothetical protein